MHSTTAYHPMTFTIESPRSPMTTITAAAYQRSHCKAPKGTGGWGFQPSRSLAAFSEDLIDEEPFFTYGTFSQAARAARAHYAAQDLAADVVIAVLP